MGDISSSYGIFAEGSLVSFGDVSEEKFLPCIWDSASSRQSSRPIISVRKKPCGNMQPLHRIQLGRAKNLWRGATKTGTIPASAHLDMNKQATLHRWDDMPVEPVKGGLGRRMITGEQMMITHVYLEKECVVPWHSHENEQITYVLQGSLKFWLGENGEQEIIVHEGEVLLIPSHLPHKAVALEDTLDVDIFCPPRQDWLDGTDAYLR